MKLFIKAIKELYKYFVITCEHSHLEKVKREWEKNENVSMCVGKKMFFYEEKENLLVPLENITAKTM